MDYLPIAFVVIGMFFAGKLMFRADTRVEERRRSAAKLSGTLREVGLTRIPSVLDDYAVGDYSGMVRGIRELGDDLKDPDKRSAEFERLFRLTLEHKLKDPEKRGTLVKLFEDLRAVHDPAFATVNAAESRTGT